MDQKEGLWAHYSIDDVWKTLRWLTINRPVSIFDMDFFQLLKEWHGSFGARFTLYCIMAMPDSGWTFTDIPDTYGEEFKTNEDWLRFGFHSITDKPFFEEGDGWEKSFLNFEEKRKRLNMGGTDCLRLHSWEVEDTQLTFLSEHGVSTILYKNEEGVSYDENGFFEKNKMTFRRTDLWLEKTKTSVPLGLKKIQSMDHTVFTHEWCFWEQTAKIKTALEFHKQNGYKFL
ncbi:MAG: hypothetical protein HFG22_00230 [Lachnospiraceae bacterium]|nr:hypothetical protein [Lachnospiraceae bacterium]